MTRRHHHIETLRSNLNAILGNTYSAQELNAVVELSHSIALTFIEGKFLSGSLNREYIRLSVHDAAYDCIADLFRRDEHNALIALVSYFSSFDLPSLSDQELLSHLRRLVFTKVNDGIVRLYHDGDPALSRIIRNIRLAVHSLGNFVEIERFGELYIAPSMCDLLEHLPKFDEEQLERFLEIEVRGSENILEIAGKLIKLLREQEHHARMVNVLQVAMTIRSLYARKTIVTNTAFDTSVGDPGQRIQETVVSTLARINRGMFSSYVEKGKVSIEEYATYFNVIKDRLDYMIQSGSMDGQSLFACLKKYHPDLSADVYKKSHRSRLEYLFRLSCEEILKEVRK